MNFPFIIREENKGLTFLASHVTDGTIHCYWGDGQPVYVTEDDEYTPPTLWPAPGMPVFFPQITRTIGFRVTPGTDLADKSVTANRYFYLVDNLDATETLNVQADHFFPPPRAGVNDFDGTNLSIYANGIRIYTPISGQVTGQDDFDFVRSVGDGQTPALNPDDVVDTTTVMAWIEARLADTLLNTDVMDTGSIRLDGGIATNPEPIVDFDVNPDYFATRIGDVVRLGLGLVPDQSRITDRVYINSGDLNLKFLNQVTPRLEEAAIENAFFGNSIQHIIVLHFANFGFFPLNSVYGPGTVLDDPFIQVLAEHLALFKSYDVDIWIDQGIADYASTIYADPDVPQDFTDQLELDVIDLVEALSSLGFVYRGRFNSEDDDSINETITQSILDKWGIE